MFPFTNLSIMVMAMNRRHFISPFNFGFRFHGKFTATHAGMYIPPNTEYVFECSVLAKGNMPFKLSFNKQD